MDIDQARTFLAVASDGSFVAAARRLHLTQSTVSARIQTLEEYLGARLFVRNRGGAVLTAAGRRFEPHAKSLVRTLERARFELGLPSRFEVTLSIGGRFALWEGFLPAWVDWMRHSHPNVSIRSEIGFEEDLMRRLIEGTMDIGLMYTPQQRPGLRVEHLFDERLCLVSSDPVAPWPDPAYIYIDWGPEFHARHSQAFPDLERPALVANIGWLGAQHALHFGGSCFLPGRVAAPLLQAGRLHLVAGSPCFRLPAYMVFPAEGRSAVMLQALEGLREQARRQHDGRGA